MGKNIDMVKMNVGDFFNNMNFIDQNNCHINMEGIIKRNFHAYNFDSVDIIIIDGKSKDSSQVKDIKIVLSYLMRLR